MTNPFDDENGEYVVLVNDEGQFSLWPATMAVPAGWILDHVTSDRRVCLEYIDKKWKDMRPNSLARAMDQTAKGN